MLLEINKLTTSPSLRSVRYSVAGLFAETFHWNLPSAVWKRHTGVPPKDTNMAAEN